LSDALVSVVLPVNNEAQVLATLLQRVRESLTACGASWEVIFVNDGSRDGSAAVLDQLAACDRRVRVVHLSRNFGHQPALFYARQITPRTWCMSWPLCPPTALEPHLDTG
jgi:polyisoprenyl-phosphate glycosyltransferase